VSGRSFAHSHAHTGRTDIAGGKKTAVHKQMHFFHAFTSLFFFSSNSLRSSCISPFPPRRCHCLRCSCGCVFFTPPLSSLCFVFL
jgi:hypothetical protein